jgi:glycosyltransferase involved in cell wall biosynthesis
MPGKSPGHHSSGDPYFTRGQPGERAQMNRKKRLNIGIVTFPIEEAGVVPIENLVAISSRLSSKLYLISGNAGDSLSGSRQIDRYIGIKHTSGANLFTRIIRYVYTQLRISYNIVKLTPSTDIWFFFGGGEGLVLPVLTARLLGKTSLLALAASETAITKARGERLFRPLTILGWLSLGLYNRLIIYSPNLIKDWHLEKYRHKISIGHQHLLDFSRFKVIRPLGERDNLVGYIGRLNQEKGPLNFVEAVPKVVATGGEARFLIGGDGPLRSQVEQYANKLKDRVRFAGWISHDELPTYLNELKLLVLPSYTEGLPNTILEAIACGTPVLATPVGAIPDVIKDGETGFIMEDNSPECIAENILRALNHPELERITRNARAFVEREFSYEKAVEMYKNVLLNI